MVRSRMKVTRLSVSGDGLLHARRGGGCGRGGVPATGAQVSFRPARTSRRCTKGGSRMPTAPSTSCSATSTGTGKRRSTCRSARTTTSSRADPIRDSRPIFFPRRNRFLFRIRVPKDFGKQEVVWTLTSHGKTERAYGTLKPDYFIDDIVIMNNNGAGGGRRRAARHDREQSAHAQSRGREEPNRQGRRTGQLDRGRQRRWEAEGETDAAAASVRRPARRRGTPNTATGLRLSWFVYRGAGKVTFDPPQIKVWEDYRDGGELAVVRRLGNAAGPARRQVGSAGDLQRARYLRAAMSRARRRTHRHPRTSPSS